MEEEIIKFIINNINEDDDYILYLFMENDLFESVLFLIKTYNLNINYYKYTFYYKNYLKYLKINI